VKKVGEVLVHGVVVLSSVGTVMRGTEVSVDRGCNIG